MNNINPASEKQKAFIMRMMFNLCYHRYLEAKDLYSKTKVEEMSMTEASSWIKDNMELFEERQKAIREICRPRGFTKRGKTVADCGDMSLGYDVYGGGY